MIKTFNKIGDFEIVQVSYNNGKSLIIGKSEKELLLAIGSYKDKDGCIEEGKLEDQLVISEELLGGLTKYLVNTLVK